MKIKSLKFGITALGAAALLSGCSLSGEIKDKAKEAATEVVSDMISEVDTQKVSEVASEVASEVVSSVKDDIVAKAEEVATTTKDLNKGKLTSAEDLNFTDTDGKGKTYTFTYDGEEFTAVYTEDNWKLIDSYKIQNEADMTIICQRLIDEHPVHGKDMASYRTADDMVYEWEIHNMGYDFFSDDERLRNKAKDVDFDPKDQGMTIEEFYESRTGKELNLSDLFGN